jgi:hypothetical protein
MGKLLNRIVGSVLATVGSVVAGYYIYTLLHWALFDLGPNFGGGWGGGIKVIIWFFIWIGCIVGSAVVLIIGALLFVREYYLWR